MTAIVPFNVENPILSSTIQAMVVSGDAEQNTDLGKIPDKEFTERTLKSMTWHALTRNPSRLPQRAL